MARTDSAVATAEQVNTGPLLPEAFRHRPGCPENDFKRLTLPDVDDEQQPRKAIGIEAYVVTGTGRYNRITGEFDRVPKAGVVRCLECAEEIVVDPADIPKIQAGLAELSKETPKNRQEAYKHG